MLQYEMAANVRGKFGKGAARTLRAAGKTPAVVYGPKLEPTALELETKPFTKTLIDIQRRNAVINLNIEGGSDKASRQVMIKELQVDPIDNSLIHADFYEISLEKPMTLIVPLKYIGKAKGVDMGGDLEVSVTELPVSGRVMDIPDQIEVDITSLGIGERLTAKDLTVPANITLQVKGDMACVAVMAAGKEATPAAGEAATAA